MILSNVSSMLLEEHKIIKSALGKIASIDQLWVESIEDYRAKTKEFLSFFREFADAYHHKKEEDQLFGFLTEKNEMLGQGVVAEMIEQHEDFRELLRTVERLVEEGKMANSFALLTKYVEDLSDHIAVEDDELYPMSDSLFSETELENIYYKFLDADRELGEARKIELIAMENTLGQE